MAPYGVDFDPIDNVLMARACGVDGHRVATEAELKAVAAGAIRRGETTVIEIPVDVEDYVPII
jgi:thiamine pyrophosphate-dependent acetolactate synthase large subunit-like protein